MAHLPAVVIIKKTKKNTPSFKQLFIVWSISDCAQSFSIVVVCCLLCSLCGLLGFFVASSLHFLLVALVCPIDRFPLFLFFLDPVSLSYCLSLLLLSLVFLEATPVGHFGLFVIIWFGGAASDTSPLLLAVMVSVALGATPLVIVRIYSVVWESFVAKARFAFFLDHYDWWMGWLIDFVLGKNEQQKVLSHQRVKERNTYYLNND